jgi:peroxiredoxin
MALQSEMIELGTAAPDFELPAVNPDVDEAGDGSRKYDDYAQAKAVVVVFMCNHCPYVKTIEDRLLDLAREMHERGIQFIGICSNDAAKYPDDAFERLAERATERNYPFPYLHDESQDVARAFGAACTPDFFVFDSDRKLCYRGRLDDGRPGTTPTTSDLKDALDQYLTSGHITVEQLPSIGCGIKWKD